MRGRLRAVLFLGAAVPGLPVLLLFPGTTSAAISIEPRRLATLVKKPPAERLTFELPGLASGLPVLALAIAALFAVAHTALTWGQLDIGMWRDPGRWLRDIERYAYGEVPYRDYVTLYPPLSTWLLGSVAVLFGSGTTPIWMATSLVYLAICLVWVRYLALLVPARQVPGLTVAGLLLAAGFASNSSAPLPLGMYAPSAPIGFLLLILGAVVALKLMARPSGIDGALLGLLAGLVVLTKHDFWPPALFLIATAPMILHRAHGATGLRAGLMAVGTSMTAVVLGALAVGMQAGWGILPLIVEGFGNFAEVRGHSMPSWDRLIAELTVLCTIAVAVHAFARAAGARHGAASRRWLGLALAGAVGFAAVFVFMDARSSGGSAGPGFAGLGVSGYTLRLAAQRLTHVSIRHLAPLLLPASVTLLVVLRWRSFANRPLRNTVAWLLLLCLAARARRGFDYVEWFHFMLELPAYAATAVLFARETPERAFRAVRLAAAPLILVGGFAYWYWGVGPLTRQNGFIAVATPKGTVYATRSVADSYRRLRDALDAADPGRVRPVFAFGYSGSYDYFLDRPSASPLTAGFRLSAFAPAPIVRGLLARRPRPFLLDLEHFKRGRRPLPAPDPFTWRLPTAPGFFARFDRPYFERLLERCPIIVARLHTPAGALVGSLHDCAPDAASRAVAATPQPTRTAPQTKGRGAVESKNAGPSPGSSN